MSVFKPFLVVSEGPHPYIGYQCDTAEEAAHALMEGYRIYALCSVHVYPEFGNHPSAGGVGDDSRRAHMARLRGELAALEEMEAADQADPENQPNQFDGAAEESEVTE